MRQEQIALQLYSIRQAMSADPHATLRAVAAMGYQAVEPLLYVGSEARAIRATLDDQGLVAPSAHVSLHDLTTRFELAADGVLTMGCQYVVVPHVGAEHRGLEGGRRLATTLNTLGHQAQERGLRLAYHNHDFEFAGTQGATMWELLAAETDPALVAFELDVYWVSVAGFDPAALIARYANRIPLIHVKERAAGEPPRIGIIGTGVLDWGRILGAAEQAGAAWYMVEHDNPEHELADVERGLRGLERVAGLV